MRTFLLTLMLAGATVAPVSIRLSKNILYAGTDLTIVCSVPRHEDNREIAAVVPSYTSSSRQLEGEFASITNRFTFKHIPCGVVQAACVLTDNHNRSATAVQT